MGSTLRDTMTYKAPLTPRQARFVEEYLIDLKPGAAGRRAFPDLTENSASAAGHRIYAEPNVRWHITQALDARSARRAIDQDAVLQIWFDIATADPNELMRVERCACRHCYGIDHKYQWRDMAEWVEAVERATRDADQRNHELAALGKEQMVLPKIPDNSGGYGFDPRVSPHAHCTRCDGNGERNVHVADTRFLSGPARRLYAGVKTTKDGIEVKTRDQDAATANLAKHLGMLTDKFVLMQNLPDDQLAAYARSATGANAAGNGTSGTSPPQTGAGNAESDPRDTSPVPRGAQPTDEA